MAILTPSFRDDLGLFCELHASVLRCTGEDVMHHVVVPDRDRPLFARIESPRLRVTGTGDLLPRRLVSALRRAPLLGPSVPKIQAVNVRRPWPPIRGWVLQQLVKMEVVSRLDADVVLLADSDLALIRPTTADDFIRDGAVRFYRGADPLAPDLERHATWHRVSRRLLGLRPEPDDRDYISSFIAWDPAIVRRIQARVREVTGMPWLDALGRELHISEFILYGCYIDHLGTPADRSFASHDSRCRSYWGTTPLDDEAAERFIASASPSDLAVHIQSASHTEARIRRRVVETLQGSAIHGA